MIKNIILCIILAGLVVFSCTKVANTSWDVTQNRTNSLSASSQQLLAALDSSLSITIYSPSIDILNIYQSVLSLYKKNSPYINYKLEHTVLDSGLSGKLKVYTEHVIMVDYKNAQHAIDIQHDKLAEQQIGAVIQQSINQSNNWIAFLTGHQEADPLNTDEFGLSAFAQLFVQQGMHIASLNLAEQKFIPQNTALLIVANPQQEFLPIEDALLHQYIADGGKVLWFTEPDTNIGAFLAEEFGIKPSKGVAIDPDTQRLGSPHPALKIITSYPEHAINEGITSATLMPWSGHLQILYEANNWQQTACLTTSHATWTYTGPATKDLDHLSKFKEHTGPLNLAIALSRPTSNNQEQRALVIADSTFMINKYLPLYANAQLAANMVAWAQNNSQIFIYNTPPLKDVSYQPSKFETMLYQYIFTFVFPLLLISIGYVVARPMRHKIMLTKQGT